MTESSLLRVYLYCAVPTATAFRDLPLRRGKKLLRRLYRCGLLARLRFGGPLGGHTYYFLDRVETNRGDLAVAMCSRQQLGAALGDVTFEEIGWRSLTRERVAEINRAGALFVIAGGGYLFFRDRAALNPLPLADAELIDQIEIPVICYGIGVNIGVAKAEQQPVICPAGASADAIRRLARRISAGTVRDPLARALLDPDGSGHIVDSVDPAFFMQAPTAAGADASCDARPRIGINFAVHSEENWARFCANVRDYAAALKRVVDHTGARLSYFVHSEQERMVVGALRTLGLRLAVVDAPPDAMLTAYRALDLHIAQMMHSSILCMGQGTPALNLAYDHKTTMFYTKLRMIEWCCTSERWTADALAAVILDRWRERNGARRHLAAVRRELAITHAAGLERICSLLRPARGGAAAPG